MTETTPYQPSDGRPQRKSRWGCIALFCTVPIGVLLLVSLTARIAWTIRESLGRSAMEKRLAEMDAQGIPTDDVSTDAEYRAQTSSKNSERWVTLLDKLESPEFNEKVTGVFVFDPALQDASFVADENWHYEEAARGFIEKHRPEIAEIVDLSGHFEAVTFPIVFESWNTLLPYTQAMRNASRLISLDGFLAIRDRDSKRLRRNIEALLGNAKVCEKEPFIVSRLVCIAQLFMAVDLAKLAIEHQRLELDELNALLPQFLGVSKLDDSWQSAVRGERSVSIPSFQYPDLAMNGKSNKPIPSRGRDCIIFLDMMAKAEQIDTPDIDALRSAGKQMSAETDRLFRNGSWLTKLDSIMSSLMAPAFEAYADALVRKLMRFRLAAIATKIEIFRRKEGRLPNELRELELSLEDLMPPGGKPFGYQLDADGNAVLWGFSLIKGMPGEAATTSTPDNPPSTDGLPHIVEDNATVTWKFKK